MEPLRLRGQLVGIGEGNPLVDGPCVDLELEDGRALVVPLPREDVAQVAQAISLGRPVHVELRLTEDTEAPDPPRRRRRPDAVERAQISEARLFVAIATARWAELVLAANGFPAESRDLAHDFAAEYQPAAIMHNPADGDRLVLVDAERALEVAAGWAWDFGRAVAELERLQRSVTKPQEGSR